MPTNHKATRSKRQREQDQKDRATERSSRRGERKARAAERAATGQVGPQISEPIAPEVDVRPAEASDAADGTSVADLGPHGRSQAADAVAVSPLRGRAMGNRLYIGNLSFDTDARTVRELFATLGEVTDVHLVTDHVSGRSRGLAFVTMRSPAEAQKAIDQLNGQTVQGRALRVNEAEQRESQRGGGGRGRF